MLAGSFLGFLSVNAQQASYTDPAAAYLRLLLEKGQEGTVQQIGAYKVRGTSYLFGEKLIGNAYKGGERALNVSLSYNTYSQQLEVYQNNQVSPLVFTPAEADSFRLLASEQTAFKEDLLFIRSGLIDSLGKRKFFQEVAKGSRFSLYKAYKCELALPKDNYIQGDLRDFELLYEYYYVDATKPGLRKLKTTAGNLKKEFKDIADVSIFVNSDEFVTNTEKVLVKIFDSINDK